MTERELQITDEWLTLNGFDRAKGEEFSIPNEFLSFTGDWFRSTKLSLAKAMFFGCPVYIPFVPEQGILATKIILRHKEHITPYID